MNGQCSICCTVFQSFDGLCSPLCGHVLHFSCLSQWLERSKTCPQCQIEINSSQIVRLSFHKSTNSTESENLAIHKKKMDDGKLKLKMALKDIDFDYYENETKSLDSQFVTLRTDFHMEESFINSILDANEAFRKRLSSFKAKFKFLEEQET